MRTERCDFLPCLGYFLQSYLVLWSRYQRGQSTTLFCVLLVLFYLAHSPRPRPSPNRDGLFLFEPGFFRYSDAAPKELRASTSSDGDDDGGTGNRRSNAGDGSDDGSSHSDDGSTDDDSRTKLQPELRCRLRLRRQRLMSQKFSLRFAMCVPPWFWRDNAEPRLAVA